MLFTAIEIDLPSEPYPQSGRVSAMLRWIVSGPDPYAGKKRSTENGLEVVDKLLRGFGEAGFDDIVSVYVEEKPVYLDTEERLSDLSVALDRALESGALKEGLKDIRLIASRQADGLHTLADVTVDDDVLVEDKAVQIKLSSRISALRVQPDETALEYRERVVKILDAEGLDDSKRRADEVATRLAQSLSQQLDPAKVSKGETIARVVVPGPNQVGRFRHLGFGDRLRKRIYRPEPSEKHKEPYWDPHPSYYYDPYHDLFSWLVVEELIQGRYSSDGITFIHPGGDPAFVGGAKGKHTELTVPLDAVKFFEHRIDVDDMVPDIGFHPAEAGTPHAPGWGGEHG